MLERVRSSRCVDAWNASSAAGSSAVRSSASNLFLVSRVDPAHDVGHRPLRQCVAAKRSGARSFAAAAYQNSALSTPALPRRAAARRASRRRAARPPRSRSPRAASSPRSGCRCLPSGRRPRRSSPGIADRAASVSRSRSVFTDVATTGPCHSRIAGTAKPDVLPVCTGPTTITDWRGSAATRRPSTQSERQPARAAARERGGREDRVAAPTARPPSPLVAAPRRRRSRTKPAPASGLRASPSVP